MRYKKLGIVKKQKGLQRWEFQFDYGLLGDEETEVFVTVKPKRCRSANTGGVKSLDKSTDAE